MSHKNRIHKKLSGNHIVWFGESNQWVGFKAPAYMVYKMYDEGKEMHKIYNRVCKKFGLNNEEGKNFVSEIINGIDKVSKHFSFTDEDERSVDDVKVRNDEIFSVRQYLIHNKRFKITYGSKLIEYYIHPPISYLEENSEVKPDVVINLQGKDNRFFMESDLNRTAQFTDSIPKLKRKTILTILDSIYNSSSSDWFSRVHASAITDGKQAIILCAQTGSGKSTLAALLQYRGLKVLADDFVPLNNKNQLAYPVPTGLSIKKGAYDVIRKYLPEFDPAKTDNYAFGSKEICFLPPRKHPVNNFKPVPVKAIIFVKYNPEIELDFYKETSFEAIGKYHNEAWVGKSYENALSFIDWFKKLECYQMEYSNTEKALDTITNLMDKF